MTTTTTIILEQLTDESGAGPVPGVRWTSTHRTILGAKRAASLVGGQTYRIIEDGEIVLLGSAASGWWDPR